MITKNHPRHHRRFERVLLVTASLIHYYIVGVSGHRWITCSLAETQPEWITCHRTVFGAGDRVEEACESSTSTGHNAKVEPEGSLVPSLLFGQEGESSSTTPAPWVEEGGGGGAASLTPSSSSSSSFSSSSEYFRICGGCHEPIYDTMDYYCPMVTDHCQIYRRHQYSSSSIIYPDIHRPECIRRPTRIQELSKTIFPFLMVSIVCIAMCLSCSGTGQRSACLIFTMCVPCLQRAYVDYLLRYRPQMAMVMIRQWIHRRGERLTQRYNELMNNSPNDLVNNGQIHHHSTVILTHMEEILLRDVIAHNRNQTGNPYMLKLTTRIFREKERAIIITNEKLPPENPPGRSPFLEEKSKTFGKDDDKDNDEQDHKEGKKDNDEDDSELDGCMICFGPICDGDRVGSLHCKHLFHVPCLKTWLKQRNVCPLCLREQVAEEVSYDQIRTN